jgi:hypothetical protein
MKRVKNIYGRCGNCKYCKVDKHTYNIYVAHCSKDNISVTNDEYSCDHECRNGHYRRHTKHKGYARHPYKNYAETYRQKD